MSYSGIILAGGKSKRMGQDKALMELHGTPMIQHAINALKAVCNEIIVVSNNPAHHSFGDIGIADNYKNAGPKAGIEAGMEIAKNDRCFVLSCDTPFVQKHILENLTREDAEIVVASCDGQLHPLIGIYAKSIGTVLKAQLHQGDFKMHHLLDASNAKTVDFPLSQIEAFQNLNTQEEWNQAIGK